MYNYITGTITDKRDGCIVVETHGIGYEIAVPISAYAEAEPGKAVKVHTYLVVREDEMSLYGWFETAQKTMFLRLISISGVGPKLAQSIISGMPAQELALSISRGDAAALTRIKGVGKKTGERIVLELRDRLAEEYGGGDITTGAIIPAGKAEDAVLALMSLGLTRSEAHSSVARVATPEMSIEDIVFTALKALR